MNDNKIVDVVMKEFAERMGVVGSNSMFKRVDMDEPTRVKRKIDLP